MLLQDLTFDQFIATSAEPGFLEKVTHVGEFSYTANTNLLGGWSEDKDRRVIFRLQSTLQEALRLSGFHNQAELKTRRWRDGVEFVYDDPDFGFTYFLDVNGRLSLSRSGSTAKHFHEWYRRFMPSLPALVMESVDTINEELTGFEKKEVEEWRENPASWRPAIRVERAEYAFSIVFAIKPDDIPKENTLLNVEILNESLLRRVPSQDGSLVDPHFLDPDEFGHVTYQVNRWSDSGRARETYRVDGPSNNNWGNLYFNFSYIGDTYVPSEGERRPFAQDEFVTVGRTAEAYLDFFRNRAVCGFVLGVLHPQESSDIPHARTPRVEYSTRPSR